jgi:hypothetical protein
MEDATVEARQRSPSYPSTPLGEAIELVRKLHNLERTNPVDRAVAAKAMGYSGISGRSATVLSNLIQFGLVEKTGKNEVRVTRRAIEILYPDTDESKSEALQAAAREPELFKSISERFTDGLPSEAALRSYLIRQGFTHVAVGPATRAFLETFLFLENTIGSGSYSDGRELVIESQLNQQVERSLPMNAPMQTPTRSDSLAGPTGKAVPLVEGYDVRIWQKTIYLGGTVRTQDEAEELITTINALKAMLPAEEPLGTAFSPEDDAQT